MQVQSTNPWNLIKIRQADWQIEDEYEWGHQNLLTKDYKWLKQSLRSTKKLPFESKLQWIESMRLARLQFGSDSVTQFQSFRSERMNIAKWMVAATMEEQDLRKVKSLERGTSSFQNKLSIIYAFCSFDSSRV
jgi:hypothetical protein